MKKIIALASVFALAACGGSDAEGDAAGEEVVAETVLPVTSAGTYVGTDAEGTEMTVAMDENGTFQDSVNGEIVRQGTWEDNIRGTCFTTEGEEGEACYNMGPVGEDGTLEVTGPDGVTTTMTKTS